MTGVRLEGGVDWIHDLLMHRLANFTRTRVVRGFPLNMPFCDIGTVVDQVSHYGLEVVSLVANAHIRNVSAAVMQVKSTAIHEAGHRDVQFGMAVKAFPYTNNIVSVWVFLVVIEPLS